jgi:FkbM family methyltransferase
VKQSHGWWFPDHEVHLIDWMNSKKNKLTMNDRCAYQGQKQLAALKHCREFNVAIDVGAHVGLWSYNLAHAFRQVEAFEPVVAHQECFEKNVLRAPPGQRLCVTTIHYCALGAADGMVDIDSEPGSSGNSTVRFGGQIEMRTLDSFGISHVNLVKIDCEGFEENVLRGGEQTIRAWKPTIVVEQKREMAARFGLQPLGAVELLKSWGYRVAEEISGDYFMVPT